MTNYETYESPFCTRYASEEMQFTFSAQKKFSTFRRLWVASDVYKRQVYILRTEEVFDIPQIVGSACESGNEART